MLGACVVGEHFQRQLAATLRARMCFGRSQQLLGDALPAPGRQYGNIVHIQQRPGLEGRKAHEAVEQPHRLFARPGDPTDCARKMRQPLAERGCRLRRQSLLPAHGVLRIGVEQHDERFCIARILVIHAADDGGNIHGKKFIRRRDKLRRFYGLALGERTQYLSLFVRVRLGWYAG